MRQNFSTNDFRSLSVYRPTLHLFPGLHEFEWTGGTREDTMYSTLFISQSLRTVRIRDLETFTEEGECATAELIRSLAYKAPWLRSLQIHTEPATDIVDRTLSRVIGTFKYLTSFSVTSELSSTALVALGSLPDLSSLSCGVNGAVERNMPPFRSRSDTPLFPTLHTLQLTQGRTSPMPCHFLASLDRSPLRTVVLRPEDILAFDGLKQLVLTLRCLPLLQHLRIEGRTSAVILPTTIYSSVLRPLKASHLHTLELLDAPFKVTDDCVKAIAMTFPGLTDLILQNGPTAMAPPPELVTFGGLLTLAANCPKLQTLRLPLRFDDVERAHLSQRSPQRYRLLRKVEVANIPARNPSVLAAVLSGIFPNASFAPARYMFYSEDPLAITASWKQVQMNMDLFNLARQQVLEH